MIAADRSSNTGPAPHSVQNADPSKCRCPCGQTKAADSTGIVLQPSRCGLPFTTPQNGQRVAAVVSERLATTHHNLPAYLQHVEHELGNDCLQLPRLRGRLHPVTSANAASIASDGRTPSGRRAVSRLSLTPTHVRNHGSGIFSVR